MSNIDLHFHSHASDGALSPQQVIERAALRQPALLALTDHDGTSGLAQARATAAQHGIPFLNGVEVSVSWGKHSVHIVGLGIDPEQADLVKGLRSIREGRVLRAHAMAEGLAKVGIAEAFEGAMSCCDNAEMIGRTHFARFLVKSGQVKDVRTVFQKYLVPGKPGYVPHQWADLAEAVGWIRAAQGHAVIAHPGRYDMGRTLIAGLIEAFKAAGGTGIEVSCGSHTLDQRHKFALLAQRHELYSSAGSDFHAPGEGGRDVGYTDDLPPICQPIWTVLAERVIAPSAKD